MKTKNKRRDTSPFLYFLMIVTLSVFSMGCSLAGSTGSNDEVRARFDPESSEKSEQERAKQLTPVLESVAEQMWLSDTDN